MCCVSGPLKCERVDIRTIEGQRVVPSRVREPKTTYKGRHNKRDFFFFFKLTKNHLKPRVSMQRMSTFPQRTCRNTEYGMAVSLFKLSCL